MRRSVGARAAQIARSGAHVGVEGVDFERVLPHQPRLERQHLLLHADARASICFGKTEQAIIRGDLDKGIGTATLEHHHLDVADLHALPLGGGQLVELKQER